MCQIFSCVVLEDGRVLTHSEPMQHSHTEIRKLHAIGDVSVNQAANVELVPPDGDFLSDVAAWKLILDHEREPEWWKDDLPALDDKVRQAVAKWQRKLTNLNALALGRTKLTGDAQAV